MHNYHLSSPKKLSGFVLAVLMLLAAAGTRPALAQQEPDENEKAMNYSLYYEEFKNANYEASLPYLRWILTNAPAYPRNNDVNFDRALIAYDSLAARSGDDARKRAYMDTVLVIFDTAVPTLKEAGAEIDEWEWTLEKGRYIQSHPQEFNDKQNEIAPLYRKLYEMDAARMQPYYINYLIADIVSQGDKQAAVDFMEEVEGKFGDNQEIMGYVTQVRNSLFRTPEERMAFLETQLKKNPEDLDIVNELFDIYRELGERGKMYSIGEQLLNMKPSPQTYRLIAKMRLDDGEAKEALDLYQKALDMPGAEANARDFYNMGIAQQQLGSLSNARSYYRRALDVDANFGPAYIAIGDLYVQAVSNCGSMEREDRAVYWLAVDYYQKAKARDNSVAAAANQKINAYSRYYPDQEALFFKGWKPGQSYSINYGCYGWIGEATTVKTP